ncbi:MAG: beta-ketoacyl reductase [Gammaproteobacteria bacterium]
MARIRAGRTYLITGGLGSLGLAVAEWMVERGARSLVLVGRRAATADAARRVADWEGAAARIVVARADISVESDVARLLSEIGDAMPPLGGIIHAAAVFDDGILLKQDGRRMSRVMAPKVAGAWNLHRLTRNLPLDFFVLFSSVTALFGWRGQGTYAAANAFLDALAHYRRGLGLPALSINWGPWVGIGAAAALESRHSDRWESLGLGSLAPDQGIRALELAMAGQNVQLAVMRVDRTAIAQGFSAESPLLGELIPHAQERHARAPLGYALVHRLPEAAPSERRNILIAHIQAEVAKILGFPPGQWPDARQGFFDLGLDSLMALELKNRLDLAVGRRLPPTLTFDCPSIEALAAHLLELLAPTAPRPATLKVAERDETVEKIRRLSESELESFVDQEWQRSLR